MSLGISCSSPVASFRCNQYSTISNLKHNNHAGSVDTFKANNSAVAFKGTGSNVATVFTIGGITGGLADRFVLPVLPGAGKAAVDFLSQSPDHRAGVAFAAIILSGTYILHKLLSNRS